MENADRNPIPLRQTEKEGLEPVRRECVCISNKTTHVMVQHSNSCHPKIRLKFRLGEWNSLSSSNAAMAVYFRGRVAGLQKQDAEPTEPKFEF